MYTGISPGLELLSYGVFMSLVSQDSAKLFPEVIVLFYTPTSCVGGFLLFHIFTYTYYCQTLKFLLIQLYV